MKLPEISSYEKKYKFKNHLLEQQLLVARQHAAQCADPLSYTDSLCSDL